MNKAYKFRIYPTSE
ncbi:MAG: helix-turn-helix domain-containing protein, partial [Clostridia bacterium]|nr:helix-turn-helix domain-containing protein [Clostridia bacterium]